MLLVGGGAVQYIYIYIHVCIYKSHTYIYVYIIYVMIKYVFLDCSMTIMIDCGCYLMMCFGWLGKSKMIQRCLIDRWISGDPFMTDHDLFGGSMSFSFGDWLNIDWGILIYALLKKMLFPLFQLPSLTKSFKHCPFMDKHLVKIVIFYWYVELPESMLN